MNRRAGLEGGQFDLADAGERAGVHPAQVVGDLHQRAREGVELAGEFDAGVLRGDAFEQVGGGFDFTLVCL